MDDKIKKFLDSNEKQLSLNDNAISMIVKSLQKLNYKLIIELSIFSDSDYQIDYINLVFKGKYNLELYGNWLLGNLKLIKI